MGHPANAHKINKYINTDMSDMLSDLPKNTAILFCPLWIVKVTRATIHCCSTFIIHPLMTSDLIA